MEWLRQLTQQAKAGSATGSASGPSGPFSEDVLLVAGDVSDSPETLQTTLEICVSAFRHVFFVPGNHGEIVLKSRAERCSPAQHPPTCSTLKHMPLFPACPCRPVGAT